VCVLYSEVDLSIKVFFPNTARNRVISHGHPSFHEQVPGVCTQPVRGIIDKGAGPSYVMSSALGASYSTKFLCFLLNPWGPLSGLRNGCV